jgi:hypothetical protein
MKIAAHMEPGNSISTAISIAMKPNPNIKRMHQILILHAGDPCP